MNTLGGETRNRVGEGALIGAGIGLIAGVALAFLARHGALLIPGFENLSLWTALSLFIIIGMACFASAGAVVGIGIPKFNPRPDQGLVKRWRSVVVKKGTKKEVFFVPEEARQKQNSTMNWKRRGFMESEKGYPRHSH